MGRPLLPESTFWLHVAISPFDEACWPWKGDTDDKGYARIRFRQQSNVLAHRAAYELEFGPIPDGINILHSCDWPRCCNPFHLFGGTQLENMRDMHAKDRAGDCRNFGEDHGRCVVTDVQVAEMKRLYFTGDLSQTELAGMFKIGQSQVGRILRGESRGAPTADAPIRRLK